MSTDEIKKKRIEYKENRIYKRKQFIVEFLNTKKITQRLYSGDLFIKFSSIFQSQTLKNVYL